MQALNTRVKSAGRPEPLRNLADQLTLFKSGGQIMPLTLLLAPRIQTPLEVNRKSHFKRLLNTYLTRFLDNCDGKDGFLLIYISNHLAYAVLKSSQVPIQTLLPLFFSLSLR